MMKQNFAFRKKLRNSVIWTQGKVGPFRLRSPLFRVPTCPSFLLEHRRNLIVRTKKKSDNFVREVRVFKFEHRAKRKTQTWKTRTILSQKSEMSEFSTWPVKDIRLFPFSNQLLIMPKNFL